ncbi:hypothetical protein CPter291_3164 [Collimonas pratensis]|uniref:Uncharacterized protein n=1 Tax=Collimonas pratensis TaxID=279113 RepID=A0ABN4MAW5_9BURK|nr:hypothetical protein CPter291_3164 [Collimonas pratensis]
MVDLRASPPAALGAAVLFMNKKPALKVTNKVTNKLPDKLSGKWCILR